MTDLEQHTCTIGPVGLDIPLHVPEGGDWSGDTGTVRGSFGGDDPIEAMALRAQFLGLADLVGGLVLCRFADRPELDGWYRLDSATHRTDGPSFSHGMFDYTAKLTRARAWQQLTQQERIVGAVRSQPDGTVNAHGIDSGDVRAWHSPGVNPLGYRVDSDASLGASRFASADGTVVVFDDTVETLFDDTVRWLQNPPDFYRASCRVLHVPAGSPKGYRVVGQQMPNSPEGWALTNDMVAVSPNNGRLRFRWWNGTRWVSDKTITLVLDTVPSTGWADFRMVRVVRESPERSTVRVLASSPTSAGELAIDVGIRRGSRTVDVAVSSLGGDDVLWGLMVDTAETFDTHIGGFHALAADADNNKLVINSPQEWTGGLQLTTAARSAAFGIGCEIGDTPDGHTAENFTDQTWRWFAAMSSHQRPVLT